MNFTWTAFQGIFHSNNIAHEFIRVNELAYKLHAKFTWNSCTFYSHEFHVKFTCFTWNSCEPFTWISCENHINFTWNSHRFHVKFTWISCEIRMLNSRELHMKNLLEFHVKGVSRCWVRKTSEFSMHISSTIILSEHMLYCKGIKNIYHCIIFISRSSHEHGLLIESSRSMTLQKSLIFLDFELFIAK
jgi:hypothetical protein